MENKLSDEQILSVIEDLVRHTVPPYPSGYLDLAHKILDAQLQALAQVKDEELKKTLQETLRQTRGWTDKEVVDNMLSKILPVMAARQALKDKEYQEAIEDARLSGYMSGKREERERIKSAFYKVFRGAGELWFPYDEPIEVELEAVNEQWDKIEQALQADRG